MKSFIGCWVCLFWDFSCSLGHAGLCLSSNVHSQSCIPDFKSLSGRSAVTWWLMSVLFLCIVFSLDWFIHHVPIKAIPLIMVILCECRPIFRIRLLADYQENSISLTETSISHSLLCYTILWNWRHVFWLTTSLSGRMGSGTLSMRPSICWSKWCQTLFCTLCGHLTVQISFDNLMTILR